MDINYSSERAVQIIIYLLKAHGIKDVIVSPGATNVTLVASLQRDSFFNLYSCVDERSAAYMACGMSTQTGRPVVLSCTGATSSRNYLPGLTEAYYSKLPILAITSMMNENKVGQLTPQATDRSNPPKDAVRKTYYLPLVTNSDEEWEVTNKVNEAILELSRNGGGPVHLRLTTSASKDYSIKDIAPVRIIRRISANDDFPQLPSGKIGIFVGSHPLWSSFLTEKVEEFCKRYNSVVFCDRTSNYFGSHRIYYALSGSQQFGVEKVNLDLLIHLGGISGDYYTNRILKPKQVWRIDLDGELRDRFHKLSYVFAMEELTFFSHYSSTTGKDKDEALIYFKDFSSNIFNRLPELPFSNIWIASILYDKLPKNSILYLGILNSLRAWNFFNNPNCIPCYANVGGFGIDGLNSTVLGAALAQTDKLIFAVVGDLGFFYDINSLGNRCFPKNIRILVVNNGRGQEFRNYDHVGDFLGESTDEYISAAGHNGFMSPVLTKHITEDLGFSYLSASNKNDFERVYPIFVNPKNIEKSIVFEVFTETENESQALKLMLNIITPSSKDVLKKGVLSVANKFFSDEAKSKMKGIIRK